MAHFPLFIDIKDKKCLVVGGGKVARRKVETLIRYGADVMVISPEVCPEISRLLSVSQIRLASLTAPELEEELSDVTLAVAASGSRRINHQTAAICHRLRIPVNVVDAPSECTFLFPAVVKKGEISIGINTGGQSPIISSRIRQEIEKTVPDYYEDIARQLFELRAQIRHTIPEEEIRRRILKKVASAAFLKEGRLTSEEIDGLLAEHGNRQESNYGTED